MSHEHLECTGDLDTFRSALEIVKKIKTASNNSSFDFRPGTTSSQYDYQTKRGLWKLIEYYLSLKTNSKIKICLQKDWLDQELCCSV